MQDQNIAIIGMSGIFPGAETLEAFYKNLSQGIDSIGELVEERRSTSCLAKKEYQLGGYLSRIDLFDYKFFNLSKREAELMDPHVRFTLQLACNTIENAGYSLQQMKGSRTAVLLGAPNSLKTSYYQLIQKFDPMIVSGNLYAMLAGRVAHFFDLHGAAMVIDTACSSALLAVHEACEKLRTGEVDYVLAGGVNLDFDFPLKDPGEERVGTESPDGKCKPFDASANGIVGGEGGGIVLLKPLAHAIQDRDHVYAIIKGGAVNQDGGRSTGITAPSPGAQKEVILRAWEKSGIDPETISYIETHGTGTKLGDPVEIQGLTQAFQQYTQERNFCAISSLKSNIGHLACAAGIASLIKVILSFQYKQLFPSLHYHVPNPYIDFDHTAVYVNTSCRLWEGREGRRRAGISAFGLSGTNVHIVLEEPPALPIDQKEPAREPGEQLVTFSAKTPAALTRYLTTFLDHLEHESSAPLSDITYTLNQGRDDYSCRFSCVIRTKEDLRAQIRSELATQLERVSQQECKVVFVFSHDALFMPEDIACLSEQFPHFKRYYQEGSREAAAYMGNDNVQRFVFQWALYRLWLTLGISSTKVIGNGTGNIVGRVIAQKLSFQEGLREVAQLTTWKKVQQAQLNTLVQTLAQSGHTLFLEMGGNGSLSREIAVLQKQVALPQMLVSPSLASGRSLLHVLAHFYDAGITINWQKYYEDQQHCRLALPTYMFEQERCWVDTPTENSLDVVEVKKALVSPAFTFRLLETTPTSTEQKLAAIWAEVLHTEILSIENDFFALGGNSLNGLQILERIKQTFHLNVEFQDMYQYSALQELGSYIDKHLVGKESARTDNVIVVEDGHITPRSDEISVLTFAQESLWTLQQLEESAAYNIPLAIALRGSLNISALTRSLNAIIKRHDTLRSLFPEHEGLPNVMVIPSFQLTLQVEDLRVGTGGQHSTALEQRLMSEFQRPFHLSEEVPFRVSLLLLDDNEHVLLVTMHHIVSDGWSVNLFLKELFQGYRAFLAGSVASLPPLLVSYRDYAIWQREWLQGPQRERDLEYWKTILTDAPLLLDLPLDGVRSEFQQTEGSQILFTLSKEITTQLRALSRREKSTLFMVLLAGWKTLLHLYSGQNDIIVGFPVAGRRVETEHLIGLFVNTLVLRTFFSANLTFYQLLQQIKQSTLDAYKNQGIPFQMMLHNINIPRTSTYHPLFQVMFDLHNYQEQDLAVAMPDLVWELLPVETRTAKFDLCLTLYEEATEISGKLEYNTRLFREETIQRFIADYLQILECIVSDIHASLPEQKKNTGQTVDNEASKDIIRSKDEEYALLLMNWNTTERAYPLHLPYHVLFERQVVKTPTAVAVICKAEQLTYEELNSAANRLAGALAKRGIQTESIVPLLAERSISFLVGILAILKAGGAYLPLDPHHPSARHRQIIEQSRCKLVLAESASLSLLARTLAEHPFEYQPELLTLEELSAQEEHTENLSTSFSPRQLAYVIYTSGSTGLPKGAMLEQRGMANHLYTKIADLYLTSTDRVAQTASQSFDISVWQFLAALLVGGTVEIIPDEIAHDPTSLLEKVERNKITVLEIVPSLLRAILDGIEDAKARPQLGHLRWLIPTGEALPPDLCYRWLNCYPQIPLINAYGPSECSDDVALGFVFQPPHPEATSIPIGRPIANTRLYVLDAMMQPVPLGEYGELYVGGVGVGRGYLHDAERTASVFLPDPFSREAGARFYKTGDRACYRPDGYLEFAGRIDHEIKIHGNLVEPGEIEAILLQQPAIQQAAVLVYEIQPADQRLVAYIVPGVSLAQAEQFVPRWRAALTERLPGYMVPAIFHMLETLPLTPNGKIDRKALPTPKIAESNETYVAPRNPHEQELVRIWEEGLQVEQVGIYDNFFSLGGDSLLAIQIAYKAKQYGMSLRPSHLMQYQTIAQLAGVVQSDSKIHADQGTLMGEIALTPIQQSFFGSIEGPLHHWNQSMLLTPRARLHSDWTRETLRILINHHDILRTRFDDTIMLPRQYMLEYDSVVPYDMIDMTHVPQQERVRYLEQQCDTIQATLNFTAGPILRCIYFQGDSVQEDRLFFVIHHLVVDGFSWRILLQDFQAIYQSLCANRTPELPAKTTSYRYWANQLAARADSLVTNDELQYWLEQGVQRSPLPLDFSEGTNSVASSEVCTLMLEEHQTHTLLHKTLAACNAQINDILLTALAYAFMRWTGNATLYLSMESHGREDLLEDVDLSHTVGWFTVEYPLNLQLDPQQSIIENITFIQAQLNRVPMRGFRYAILHYLVSDINIRRLLNTSPLPEISFNYLGQYNQLFSRDALFELAQESTGSNRDPACKRQFVIDINGAVANNCLEFTFEYSNALHYRHSIQKFTNYFQEALQEIIQASQPQTGQALAASSQYDEVIPLTHTHRWFFEQEFTYIHQWNTGMVMQVKHHLEPEIFRETCRLLLIQQEVLNYRFEQSTEGWQQYHRPFSGDVPFAYYNFSSLSVIEQRQMIEQVVAQAQSSLHITEGPLLRIILFDLGAEQWQRLFITTHHLVIDHLSWTFLLETIQALYTALEQERTPDLLFASTPFKEWAIRLANHVRTTHEDPAVHNWFEGLRGNTCLLPRDYPDGLNQERFLSEVHVVLPVTETQALLQDVRSLLQIHIADLLLSVLAMTLCHWSQAESILIDQGGHGREDLFEDVDLSGTIGWFTTSLPIRLPYAPAQSLLEQILNHKALLIESRHYGFSFVIQKYLHPEEEVRRLFSTLGPAIVSFDYETPALATTFPKEDLDNPWFEAAPEERGPVRHPDERRTHELDIRGWIEQGQLKMNWFYSSDLYRKETIERLVNNYVSTLQSVLKALRL